MSSWQTAFAPGAGGNSPASGDRSTEAKSVAAAVSNMVQSTVDTVRGYVSGATTGDEEDEVADVLELMIATTTAKENLHERLL